MRRRGPALKVLLFTGVAAVVFALLAILVGNVSFSDSREFTAVFTDVTGVNENDPVRIAGVEVGSVEQIGLTTIGGVRRGTVGFDVRNDVPVFRHATVELRYDNLIGNRYLAVVETPGGADTMPAGGTFGLSQTKPALNLTTLLNGFRPLFAALSPREVNDLTSSIIKTLQGEGGTLGSVLADTARLTNRIADRDAVIGRVITNFTAVLGTLDQRRTQLASLITNFRDLMRGLAGDTKTIDATLPDLASLLGSTSELTRQVRPGVRDDVRELGSLAKNLAGSSPSLDSLISGLPERLNTFTRLGSYGSWFNFYVCGLQLDLTLLGQSAQLTPSAALTSQQRNTACGLGYRQ